MLHQEQTFTGRPNNICLGSNNIQNLFCADTSISSSDSRDKTDIVDFTKGLDWIKALRPVTYRWDRLTGMEQINQEPYGNLLKKEVDYTLVSLHKKH